MTVIDAATLTETQPAAAPPRRARRRAMVAVHGWTAVMYVSLVGLLAMVGSVLTWWISWHTLWSNGDTASVLLALVVASRPLVRFVFPRKRQAR